MKLHLLRLVLIALSLGWYAGLRADDTQVIAAVRAADDDRVAATIAAEPNRLDAILSADLRYAHSTGKVDSKASYTDTLVSHRTIYRPLTMRNATSVPSLPGWC